MNRRNLLRVALGTSLSAAVYGLGSRFSTFGSSALAAGQDAIAESQGKFVILPYGAPPPSNLRRIGPSHVVIPERLSDGAPSNVIERDVAELGSVWKRPTYAFEPNGVEHLRRAEVVHVSGEALMASEIVRLNDALATFRIDSQYFDPHPLWPQGTEETGITYWTPVSFTPTEGFAITTGSGPLVHWIDHNLLYTLELHDTQRSIDSLSHVFNNLKLTGS